MLRVARAWTRARSRWPRSGSTSMQHCRWMSAAPPPPPQVEDPEAKAAPPPALIDEEEARIARQRAEDIKAIYEGRMNMEIATRVAFGESRSRKPKTFGLDWHLWQFFVSVVIPVTAIYLVAMYARRDIRRLEKEKGIDPLPKMTWENRHEVVRLQKEYQAKRMLKRAGLNIEELKSLKGRLDSIDDKLARVEGLLSRPPETDTVDRPK